MKNATFLGLCFFAAMFGLVAAALGQQPTAPGEQPAATQPAQPGQQPAGQIGSPNQQPGAGDALFDRQSPGEPGPAGTGSSNGTGPDLNGQPAAANGQRVMGPAGAPLERSMRSDGQPVAGASQMMGAGPKRGELGVWLVESGGPGVEISRITDGSAAKQAGLRAGDIILQVNGHGASSPEAAARIIRQIPIGQAATLMIWRDGDQQQMQVAMQPARESYQVGFRGEGDSAKADLASRTMRLEQQLGTIAQELQQLRQEMAQLRTAGGQSVEQKASPAPHADPLAPPSGFERPAQKSTQPSGTPDAGGTPASTPDGQNATKADPFGNEAVPPKAGETPKAGAESKAGKDSNSLFQ